MKTFGEYGRKRLLMYADSFYDLAESFSGEICVTEDRECKSREQLLRERHYREAQRVLQDNLKEMSQILHQVAEETVVNVDVPERLKRRVCRLLAREKIMVKDIHYIEENASGKYLLAITMYSEKTGGHTTRDVADMLSVIMDKRLNAATGSYCLVDGNERTFFFVEDPPFLVLTGYARATREQENVSGDNYSVLEMDNGKMVIMLSDGMGSGERAGRESRTVIERLETLLEAGHSEASAINIVNNTLLAAGEPTNMSTLDMCSVDLYTGRCEFRKLGGAASFIKSNVFVEPIVMNRLPLGIYFREGDETIVRELMDNDYLIMITDGVLDAFSTGDYEEMLCQYLRDLRDCPPAEVAQRILQFALKCSGGRVKDDMTVLVLEVFYNSAVND